ncbi:MAG: 3-methyl-2-oxobutanoate hydroxymethyltransferase [Anaerolineae bacterium]
MGPGCTATARYSVFHDLLGLFDRFTPKFVKKYADLRPAMLAALQAYRQEVGAGDSHPGP